MLKTSPAFAGFYLPLLQGSVKLTPTLFLECRQNELLEAPRISLAAHDGNSS